MAGLLVEFEGIGQGDEQTTLASLVRILAEELLQWPRMLIPYSGLRLELACGTHCIPCTQNLLNPQTRNPKPCIRNPTSDTSTLEYGFRRCLI